MNGSRLSQSALIELVLMAGMLLVFMPAIADEGELEEPERKSPPEVMQLEPPLDVPTPDTDDHEARPDTDSAGTVDAVDSFMLLDAAVAPGTLRRLSWYATENTAGLSEATPVLVAHGEKPGPTLCLTAAVHGDELNGIEIVRNLLYEVEPERLNGTVIGVPIVNLYGFRHGSRYLSDRRDLNRYFPGDPEGSMASRIAHSLFESVIQHCDYLADLHTASFRRANMPQLRANLNNDAVLDLTKGFGATVVLHGEGPDGSLRKAATDVGIPAITLEAGEPMRVQPREVSHGIKALHSLLNYLDMMQRFSFWGEPQPIYYESQWVRAENNGILTSTVELGARVDEGELLGRVIDPITNSRSEIRSPVDGRVIGMALNQSMRPGYAAYHIGIHKTEDELVDMNDLKSDAAKSETSETSEQDKSNIRDVKEMEPTE